MLGLLNPVRSLISTRQQTISKLPILVSLFFVRIHFLQKNPLTSLGLILYEILRLSKYFFKALK